MRAFISVALILSLSLSSLLAQMQLLPESDEPEPYTYAASNGFLLAVFPHEDHHDVQGSSSGGESATFHLRLPEEDGGVIETTFGEAVVRATIRDDGTSVWDELETADGIVGAAAVGEQQRLVEEAEGGATSATTDLDLTVYEDLVAYALTRNSASFWQEFQAAGAEYEAAMIGAVAPAADSCTWTCLSCVVALAGYGFSFAALLAACGASAGLGCIAAVLGWEVAKAAIVLACVDCIVCLKEKEKNDDERSGHAGLPRVML